MQPVDHRNETNIFDSPKKNYREGYGIEEKHWIRKTYWVVFILLFSESSRGIVNLKF